jgi:hypothetical protein
MNKLKTTAARVDDFAKQADTSKATQLQALKKQNFGWRLGALEQPPRLKLGGSGVPNIQPIADRA